jgi:hypothetical protein
MKTIADAKTDNLARFCPSLNSRRAEIHCKGIGMGSLRENSGKRAEGPADPVAAKRRKRFARGGDAQH